MWLIFNARFARETQERERAGKIRKFSFFYFTCKVCFVHGEVFLNKSDTLGSDLVYRLILFRFNGTFLKVSFRRNKYREEENGIVWMLGSGTHAFALRSRGEDAPDPRWRGRLSLRLMLRTT